MMRKLVVIVFTLCFGSAFGIENSLIQELNPIVYMEEHFFKFSDNHLVALQRAIDAPCKLRVMSYNILSKYYDRLQIEENRWEHRKNRVLALIRQDAPDVLCCQELTVDQILDLTSELGTQYEVYAPLPNEEKYCTEVLGIFYDKQRFTLKSAEKQELGVTHFSEELQSYCFQYFLKAVFVDKPSGEEFVVYNTHADYLMPGGRMELVDFLLKEAEQDASKYPTILTGDFNTHLASIPTPFKEFPLAPVLDGPYIQHTLTRNHFRDSLNIPLIAHVGPLSTFTYVQGKGCFAGVDSSLQLTFDHIFVTPATIRVIFHLHEPATVDGSFPSDHIPVIADVAIGFLP